MTTFNYKFHFLRTISILSMLMSLSLLFNTLVSMPKPKDLLDAKEPIKKIANLTSCYCNEGIVNLSIVFVVYIYSNNSFYFSKYGRSLPRNKIL